MPEKPANEAALPTSLYIRLGERVWVEAQGRGTIIAAVNQEPVTLGKFGAAAIESLKALRAGMPLASVGLDGGTVQNETGLLSRRLAALGLLDFPIRAASDSEVDLAVIEPQAPGYWPRLAALSGNDTLVLSRFAYLRRRDGGMVLESPRAKSLVRLCDPKLAALLLTLAAPQNADALRSHDGFPGMDVFSLLLESDFLFKTSGKGDGIDRYAEGDGDLALWDFHDLLFHSRCTEGRHTNPAGGTYPHQGSLPQKPTLRPSWPGPAISLLEHVKEDPANLRPIAKMLRERHSTRSFDDGHPITLAELAEFLDGTARVLSEPSGDISSSGGAPTEDVRPYPSAGGSWELELYLTVNHCAGLSPGFYHYNAAEHGLVKLEMAPKDMKEVLLGAAGAMGEMTPPQVLVTIAARFGRVSWKYSSIAYSLILKDTGVLMQTMYLMASGMGLGGCAIGLANIEQFAKITGLGFHVEGPAGLFALGRPRRDAQRT